MAHLYFKNNSNGKGWGERTPFEKLHKMGVMSSLIELEGLGLVAGTERNWRYHRPKPRRTGNDLVSLRADRLRKSHKTHSR